MPWIRSPSPMLSPIGVRGSSDAYGSWKMICIRRRYGLSSAPLSPVMSVPSKRIVPRRRVDQAQEQPADRGLAAARLADEARASRRGGSRSGRRRRPGPRPTVRCSTPPRIGKCLTRSRTSTSGVAVGRGAPLGSVGGGGRRRPALIGRRSRRRPASRRSLGASARRPRRGTASSGPRGPARPAAAPGGRSVAIATSCLDPREAARREPAAGGRSMRLGTLPGMTASSS